MNKYLKKSKEIREIKYLWCYMANKNIKSTSKNFLENYKYLFFIIIVKYNKNCN